MSRKQFIESHGATCDNWTWSWSFINKAQKIIIFGAWTDFSNGPAELILSESWKYNAGRKSNGYGQSREHIRLIEEEGYQLKTFPMKYSDDLQDAEGNGPAKIEDFTPILSNRTLRKDSDGWYAYPDPGNPIPEEIDTSQKYIEGASQEVSVNTYERNADARAKCIAHHGYKCSACSFDFEEVYGAIGKNYIHVHHIVPLSEIREEYEVDPINDLIPVCPNCHAIIHRTQPALTVKQLREHLLQNKKNI